MTNKFYENVLMIVGAFSDDMDYARTLAEQLVEKAKLTPPEFDTMIIMHGKFCEVLVSVRGMRWVMNQDTRNTPMHVPVFRVNKTTIRIFKYFANVGEGIAATNSKYTDSLDARVFHINQSDEGVAARDIDKAALNIQEFFLVPGRLITK